MYFNLSSSTDSYLSYRLWQQPNEIYYRKFGPLNLMGKFNVEDDKLIYNFTISNSINKKSNILNQYDLNIIYKVFIKVLRKRINEDLIDIFIDKNFYEITFGNISPFIKLPNKLILIAEKLGISIELSNNNITFKSIEFIQFNTFWKKVFVLLYRLLFIYNRNDIIILEKTIFKQLSNNWKKELNKKEQYYLFHKLFNSKEVDFVPLFNTLNKDINICNNTTLSNDKKYKTIVETVNKLNCKSILHIGGSLLDYYFIKDNKNRPILSLDNNNDTVLLLRRTKPIIDNKPITNAYYTNLDFLQCNYSLPLIKDYKPYDALIIEDNTFNNKDIIIDFYQPKILITFAPYDCFSKYLLLESNELYVYNLISYNYKESKWKRKYETYIKNHELNNIHNLIYRLLNIGLCNYESKTYDKLNFNEILEIGIKNSRLYQLEVV